MRARGVKLRRTRRMFMSVIRLWNQCAHHSTVTLHKGQALSSRLLSRRASAVIRSWFYRVSCLRGVMSTRTRKFRSILHRGIRFWCIYASTKRAAVAMGRAVDLARMEQILLSWCQVLKNSDSVITKWTTVSNNLSKRLEKENTSARILFLCSTWRAFALLSTFSLHFWQNLKKLMFYCWREQVREYTNKYSEVVERVRTERHANKLKTVLLMWKSWVDQNSATRRKLLKLHAQSKRMKLSASRVEVSFGVWRMHVRLQGSIISYIYKRGASSARILVAICLSEWARCAKRFAVGRQALILFCQRLLGRFFRRLVLSAKMLKRKKIILTKAAVLNRKKSLSAITTLWRHVLELKVAHQHVSALVRLRNMSRAVDKWWSWKCKRQRLQRICTHRSGQARAVKLRFLLSHWLRHTSYQIRIVNALSNVWRKRNFRFLQASIGAWISHTSTALHHANICRQIQEMGVRNLFLRSFSGLAQAKQQSKRLCAIHVLIIRSSNASISTRSWQKWCTHMRMEKAFRCRIYARNLRICRNTLNLWASITRILLLLFQKSAALDRKLRVLRRRSTFQLWRSNVTQIISVDLQREAFFANTKCSSMRIRIEYCLKCEVFNRWSRIKASSKIQTMRGMASTYIERFSHTFKRDKMKKTSQKVIQKWKQIISCNQSIDFALYHLECRRSDRTKTQIFLHWNLTLVIQRQLWSAFERMRSRRSQSRLCHALHLWKEVVARKLDVAEGTMLQTQGNNHISLLPKRVRRAFDALQAWKRFYHLQQYICEVLMLKVSKNKALIQQSVLLLWSQHVERTRSLHRNIEIGLKNASVDIVKHCLWSWVQSVNPSVKRSGIAISNSAENFAEAYVNAKHRASAIRILQAFFATWTERIARRKVLEDWAINLYSQRRLDRIENEVNSRHLKIITNVAFCTMGKFVREKRKIRKKFGELRSTFACLSCLVPASPLAGDQ